jgi:alkylation response protein AidB-like acyl-CoA dehydrogenase
MPGAEQVLEEARRYLREEVKPKASEIDQDPEALREALRGLCERGLMGLRIPQEFGGPGLREAEFREYQQEVARYSGSLAFLQTQHQSAGSMISKCDNDWLKNEYLPRMSHGQRLMGIGFSQLRKPGPPSITAVPVDGGFVLEGKVPWATGYTFYPEILIGATLPDGRAIFGVVPLESAGMSEAAGDRAEPGPAAASRYLGASPFGVESAFSRSSDDASEELPRPGSISLSEPMRLATMESALTVSAEFRNWFLPERLVVFVRPADWIRNNDMINIVLQGHFALGCARGSLDVLQEVAEKKGLPFLQEAFASLDEELEACREATEKGRLEDDAPQEEPLIQQRLRIRAWAIDLAVRCAHAAVTASSGAANSLQHPAQRLYREALVYTVSAQTPAIMEATLNRLIARREAD